MPAEFDEQGWKLLSGGLMTVRDTIGKHDKGVTRAEEREALIQVATHPAFEGLGPDVLTLAERGRWIAARVRERLLRLLMDPVAADLSEPARRAVRCWAAYVDEGLKPAQLYTMIFDDAPGASAAARRNQVRALMWTGGTGDEDAIPGIQLLAAMVRTALLTDVPGGTGIDAVAFDYEWRRLRGMLPVAQDLLMVLAHLAPANALPIVLLGTGGDYLPGALPATCANLDRLHATSTVLRDMGLADLRDDFITVDHNVCGLVLARTSPQEHTQWIANVVRFLRVALPPDTYDRTSWEVWQYGYPHVLKATESAREQEIQLGDVVHLLDRASVFQREARNDAVGAVDLSQQAVEVSVELGPTDNVLHATCLGNLALAYYRAGRMDAAGQTMRQCLEFSRSMLGEDSDEFRESHRILNAWGESSR